MRERKLHTTHDTDDHIAHCFDYSELPKHLDLIRFLSCG
jgi:hypothetical protein